MISEQRLFDIEYWKKELDDKLDVLTKEIESLLAFKTRIEKAMESCREPLHIARQCLANRYVFHGPVAQRADSQSSG